MSSLSDHEPSSSQSHRGVERSSRGRSNHSSVRGSPPHATTSSTALGEIDRGGSPARDAAAADRARPTAVARCPGPVRPARPARWSAASAVMRSVSRLSMPRSAS